MSNTPYVPFSFLVIVKVEEKTPFALTGLLRGVFGCEWHTPDFLRRYSVCCHAFFAFIKQTTKSPESESTHVSLQGFTTSAPLVTCCT